MGAERRSAGDGRSRVVAVERRLRRLVAIAKAVFERLASGAEADLNHRRGRAAVSSLRVVAEFGHAGAIAGRSGMCSPPPPVYTRHWAGYR